MSAASPVTGRKPTARDRLLASAGELFYAEGVHTVGIDRVIEHAGVAKASLYSCFGNKEGLIKAYIEDYDAKRRRRITTGLERFATPRDKVLGVFDLLAEQAAGPEFRGCAFYNAVAEGARDGEPAEAVAVGRRWTRELFTRLARDAGAADPETLAAQLVVLYNGALYGTRMEQGPGPVLTARAIAATLLP
ncbi:TetR/AcrR family transcriptional regulator [Actinoplanes sp. RD1]|uniref:TetR/AcrR family transcriptional regulator n=1 Tax=Actinoplanes sp. RD1 TaxID=3064538 RepID=UPI0027420B7E|nr:TetR/AcrR family transcriptional regulator [Actinoplanes sp. RD1]